MNNDSKFFQFQVKWHTKTEVTSVGTFFKESYYPPWVFWLCSECFQKLREWIDGEDKSVQAAGSQANQTDMQEKTV